MPKERQTCTECSMRRQKCDREQPCSRCIKRGEPEKCTREWPKGGYDPRKHRVYPRPEKGDHGSPSTSTEYEHNHDSPKSPVPARAQAPTVSAGSRASQDLSNVISPPPTNLSAPNDQEKEVLEFLTWGRGNLADYQVKSFDLIKEPFKNNARPCPEQEYSNGFGNAHNQQLSFLQLLLPRREQVFYLIDYHIKTVLWYHACFHGDTFRNELQAQYASTGTLQLGKTDLRWSALLFAIMSASMACANEHLTATWGFQKGERAKLMRQWYKACLTCLNLSDYMWRHHLNSISAICVLTMSGHILGFSNTQSTLHGAGLKIAQGLGLQRLGPEPDEGAISEHDMTPAKREKILRREVGRRVWGQLCNQDWFSIPFSEMYTIQRSHFSTSKPQHIDERKLVPLPAHEPSGTSFTRCLNDIAAILPQAHDALTNASTLYTKYEQILHFDAKMKSLSNEGIPSFFSMNELIRPEWPEWLPWARRSLRICFAHKTIMVHRSFLGKSLSDPTFAHTRKTCMEASKVILKEARQAQDTSEGPALWIDQAFMVAAGITLSLDIFHRKTSEPEYEEHRKLVETTVNMLGKFDHSMIAIRGVRLLTSLLAEQARLTAERSMNNYKKRTHDDIAPSTTPGGTTGSPGFMHVGDGGSFTNAMKRPKFDVPKFLESFVGGDTTFTQSLRASENPTFANDSDTVVPSSLNANGDLVLGNGRLGNVLMQQPSSDKLPALGSTDPSLLDPSQGAFDPLGLPNEYGYEAFEQIFPPHADEIGLERQTDGDGQPIPVVENSSNGVAAAVSTPPAPQETPTRARMRKVFQPSFMKLKQPAIPGLWGEWDPVTGSEEVPTSEWPQFNPADVPLEPPLFAVATEAAESGSQSNLLSRQGTEQAGIALGVLPSEGFVKVTDTMETNVLSDKEGIEAQSDSVPESSTSDTGTAKQPEVFKFTLSSAALSTSYLPSQTFFPTRPTQTLPSPQADEALQYTAPKLLSRPINPSIDIDKDLAVKIAMVEARKSYGSGPMWGVAAPPPITFDGTEDYDRVTSIDSQILQDQVSADVQKETNVNVGSHKVSSAISGNHNASAEGGPDQRNEVGDSQGQGGLHTWIGNSQWWRAKW